MTVNFDQAPVAMKERTTRHGPIEREQLVRMATLVNDFNPIHFDDGFAAACGLPGVVMPATLMSAWVLADLEPEFPAAAVPRPHPIREIDVRFRAPVFVGEMVEFSYKSVGEGEVHVVVRAGKPEVDAEGWRQVSDGVVRWTPTA